MRTVADILLREQLDQWQTEYPDIFKIVYCVGSRWDNIHWGAKKQIEYKPPPPPKGFETLIHGEVGWVNEDKLRKHGFPPSEDTRVIVCGLPGVYDKLCGPRDTTDVIPHSILATLGYQHHMIIKL